MNSSVILLAILLLFTACTSPQTGAVKEGATRFDDGYLFFCGDDNARLEALKTNRTANILVVEDRQRLVQELLPIEKLLKLGQPVIPHEYIKIGQRCRVTAGPLAGTEGIVVQSSKETRLILQVDMLGQAASVEIDFDMVEKLDE